eukprot:TRINITY_DN7319_c0_g1_i1.p1 TRINITY_DN7319_c0_g1~~TRINITY_DN7319_c0_g1_i1.p1  ORF type:complete len:247 (+),score=55.73 TRINITY_DN7319_c0_g1_i1:208-948(+)
MKILDATKIRAMAEGLRTIPKGVNLLEGIELPGYAATVEVDEDDYTKMDKKSDKVFYKRARMEAHMATESLEAIRTYYKGALGGGDARHLEMCASVFSYFPEGYTPQCHGVGLNEDELSANKALTDGFTVQNLNKEPNLPFADNSFGVCTHVASIEYLTDPIHHCRELNRVLAPSSPIHVIFTNRAFWTKSTKIWTTLTHDERTLLTALYLSYAGFHNIAAYRLAYGDERDNLPEPVAVVTGTAQA